MNTLHIRKGGILLLAIAATLSILAQSVSSTDYDFLLSISEPARYDLYDRNIPKEDYQVVPIEAQQNVVIDFSHPLPQIEQKISDVSLLTITEHLQLATAYRLRGDYVRAVPHYAHVVRLSNQPIHAFFYAQALRASNQDLLADIYQSRYKAGIGGPLQKKNLSDSEREGIPAMIYGSVSCELYNRPIANVEVRLVNVCTEEEVITRTDADGNYNFKNHPADCAFVIRFEKRLYDAALVEKDAPRKDYRIDIELEHAQGLSFR